MDLWGPHFPNSRDPIFSDSRYLMIIFSDSRNPIFNSRDPNRVPETPLKKLIKCLLAEIQAVSEPLRVCRCI